MGGGDVARAITELFSKRIGETKRVKVADRFGGAAYAKAGLGKEFETAINNTLLCVKIRNQYAPCIWHDNGTGQLAFAHLEEIAAPIGPTPDVTNLTFSHIDIGLLNEQAAFFFYVKDSLNYLNYKRRQLLGDIGAGAVIRIPTVVARPQMHL